MGVVSTLGALAVKKLVDNVRHRRAPHRRAEKILLQAVPADILPTILRWDDVDQGDLQSKLVSLMVSPDDRGMFVIAAPPGDGKTKTLAKAMSVVKGRGIPILYVNGLTDCTLPDLGISTAAITGHLAKGSVFVIDQMDDGKDDITTSIKLVLSRLATESSNSRMFKVIVVVSKVNIRDLILELNSGEKIVAFNQPREFFWTVAMLEQLCELRLPNWPTRDRQRLTALVSKAGSPALLMGLCHSPLYTQISSRNSSP